MKGVEYFTHHGITHRPMGTQFLVGDPQDVLALCVATWGMEKSEKEDETAYIYLEIILIPGDNPHNKRSRHHSN